MSQNGSRDEYKGAGQIVNTLGKGTVYGLIAAIPALLAGIGVGYVTKSPIAGIVTRTVVWGGAVVTGWVKGWNQASHAQEQHKNLVSDNSVLKAENKGLSEQVQLTKSFAEKVISRAPDSHAERVSSEDKSAVTER
ncbi:MAG: hypothetical protein K2Q12_02355 [Rickettsiales bacterium]|nr:hypothetical protein [Rickettsiales bacterium]